MSEGTHSSNIPDDVHQSLIGESDVKTKVGHVAKFDSDDRKSDLEQNVVLDNIVNPKKSNEFIGLTKEELKRYINNPKWKRIRWIIAIIYILILVLLLIGSIVLVISSKRCPPKVPLVWYEKDIIYEIDVTTFRDTDQDGIGDIKGVQEKLEYFEKNNIKSILLQSSIFNATGGTSIQLDGKTPKDKNIDLLTIDPLVGTEEDLQNLAKILNRKDMHLIIDLPLSSILDPNGYIWYGSTLPLSTKINNPCLESNSNNLGCRYYEAYGRLPLDFNQDQIYQQSKLRLERWLTTKNIDGVMVNLPLQLNSTTRSYEISYDTIHKWNQIRNNIQKNSKPKLFLIDIPFALQNLITQDDLHNKSTHSVLAFDNNRKGSKVNARLLHQTIQSYQQKQLSKPLFWQLGSKRRSDHVGAIQENQLSKEMVLTMGLLFGGTPVILYGEEIGLDQISNPLMAWTPDGSSGGFSSCSLRNCSRILSSYKLDLSKTSVKRQEALGGESKDSLLTVFRHLSKLRLADSFQFGLLETGYEEESNTFWFIREAPGHRGYIIVFNLNTIENHLSLYELTKHDVPLNIHYEYQWPKVTFPRSNSTHIDSDNLLISPQSINIFWWTPKIIKPNILFKKAKEHSNIH